MSGAVAKGRVTTVQKLRNMLTFFNVLLQNKEV